MATFCGFLMFVWMLFGLLYAKLLLHALFCVFKICMFCMFICLWLGLRCGWGLCYFENFALILARDFSNRGVCGLNGTCLVKQSFVFSFFLFSNNDYC